MWDLMNSLISPFSIHSDTITNCLSSIVTPKSGNTFGWLRAFHLMASLQNLCAIAVSQPTLMFQMTYLSNYVQVTCQVYPQDLCRDSSALIITHPHVCEPTTVLGYFQPVIAKRDFQRPRKQSPVTAYTAQSLQPLPPRW